ncbi:MaoC-like domain-containing protein [Hyphomicrobiales bacterium]|nr:MaoC-like domain-containing protein [Hyphomicrobiales bacterium]CAH1692316.1 Enoyl-CoA hydratase [Hyphomicrobiales bacterium]
MSIPTTFQDLIGYDLGSRAIGWTERDAILYALACGAKAHDLDLIYERDLRTLPGIVAALGLWAVERCGDLGVYDRKKSLHVSQGLTIRQPLPASGHFETRGRVIAVWDKGKATIVEIEVACDAFTAGYSIFLPGVGGWGGSQPPAMPSVGPAAELAPIAEFQTSPEQAVLYRLTGDLHPVHVDFEIARAYGFARPILHGLCTLGIALRALGPAFDTHPAMLTAASARLSAPVLPGDLLNIRAATTGECIAFEVGVADRIVLKDGVARFS